MKGNSVDKGPMQFSGKNYRDYCLKNLKHRLPYAKKKRMEI